MKKQMTYLVVLALAASVSAAPRMTLPEVEFNFGYVPQNSSVSHIFWLKSSGDDSLKILQVVPGCGCTKAPLERDHLAPGDSTRVEIIFSTGSYSGAVSKSPRLQTNEGAPDKALRILTNVVTRPDSTYPVVLKPYKLDMTQFGEKSRSEIRFTIENRSSSPLSPQMISTFGEYFEVLLPKSIPAEGNAEAILKLKPAVLDRPFDKSFTIQFDDEQKSRFTIPVKRQIRTQAQMTGAATTSTGK